MFNAFKYTSPDKLKILILGQDPYPKKGQAHGLALSSGNRERTYSLDIIFKDLALCDYDGRTRRSSDLTNWAKQGVMLLNTCLTTEVGQTFAHKDWGWEYFTREVVKVINQLPQPYAVFAWGKPAQQMVHWYIKPRDNRLILQADHPAAERYGYVFVGSKHFEIGNEFLRKNGITPIDWMDCSEMESL
jgi:uracil-DNA glycosylase